MHQCRAVPVSMSRRRLANQAGKSSGPGWAPAGMKRRLSSSGPSPGPGASVSRHGRSRSRAVSNNGGWVEDPAGGTFSADTAFSADRAILGDMGFSGDEEEG